MLPSPLSIIRRRLVSVRFALWLIAACYTPILGAQTAPKSAPAAAWWQDAMFYEIFVRSFADASSGPLAGDGIGDLQGLIEHLDYLNDGRGTAGQSLGVTAVWLMPIHPSPTYHGYDVSDYFAVNPQFGDLALFRRFVDEAHRRGIRVIIDLVPNHAAADHPLFRAALAAPAHSDARQPFRFADLPENIVGPWDQRAWHRAAGDGFYYAVFDRTMPDWNFREPRVTEHHRRVAKFWLQEVGVDGFRLDAVRYLVETGDDLQDTEETRQWLREFTAYCHTLKPDAFVIGENTARSREIARCIRGGSLDSAFEFDLSRAIYESIRMQTPGILTQALRQLDTMYEGATPWATFLTNHDQERVRTQLGDDESLARFAAKLAFTLPGVPFFYYGDELGMRGAKPDPDLRTPMPWTADSPNAGFTNATTKPWHALNPDFSTINVATEQAAPDSMLALYRKLVLLNQSSAAIRHGRMIPLTVNDRRVFAAMRTTDHEAVLTLANYADEPVRGFTLDVPHWPTTARGPATEELEGATIHSPTLSPDGAVNGWVPCDAIPAKSVRVVCWRQP